MWTGIRVQCGGEAREGWGGKGWRGEGEKQRVETNNQVPYPEKGHRRARPGHTSKAAIFDEQHAPHSGSMRGGEHHLGLSSQINKFIIFLKIDIPGPAQPQEKKKSALVLFASNDIKQKQDRWRGNSWEFLLVEKNKLSGDADFCKMMQKEWVSADDLCCTRGRKIITRL